MYLYMLRNKNGGEIYIGQDNDTQREWGRLCDHVATGFHSTWGGKNVNLGNASTTTRVQTPAGEFRVKDGAGRLIEDFGLSNIEIKVNSNPSSCFGLQQVWEAFKADGWTCSKGETDEAKLDFAEMYLIIKTYKNNKNYNYLLGSSSGSSFYWNAWEFFKKRNKFVGIPQKYFDQDKFRVEIHMPDTIEEINKVITVQQYSLYRLAAEMIHIELFTFDENKYDNYAVENKKRLITAMTKALAGTINGTDWRREVKQDYATKINEIINRVRQLFQGLNSFGIDEMNWTNFANIALHSIDKLVKVIESRLISATGKQLVSYVKLEKGNTPILNNIAKQLITSYYGEHKTTKIFSDFSITIKRTEYLKGGEKELLGKSPEDSVFSNYRPEWFTMAADENTVFNEFNHAALNKCKEVHFAVFRAIYNKVADTNIFLLMDKPFGELTLMNRMAEGYKQYCNIDVTDSSRGDWENYYRRAVSLYKYRQGKMLYKIEDDVERTEHRRGNFLEGRAMSADLKNLIYEQTKSSLIRAFTPAYTGQDDPAWYYEFSRSLWNNVENTKEISDILWKYLI